MYIGSFDHFEMKQGTTSTPFLSPFNGKTIVVDLGRETGFKAKQELINYLREQQAHIAYILTASVCFLFISLNIGLKVIFTFRLIMFWQRIA